MRIQAQYNISVCDNITLMYGLPPKKESSYNVRLGIKWDRLSGFAILVDILARKR